MMWHLGDDFREENFKPFACPIEWCPYRCKQKSNLKAHAATHLKIRDTTLPPGGKFECAWGKCQHAADTVAAMEMHMISHMGDNYREEIFECTWPNCRHTTNKKHSMAVHMNGHTRETVFKCDEDGCDYEALRNYELMEHKATVHCDERNFPCTYPGCGYASKLKRYLLPHLRMHAEDKTFVCDFEQCKFATVYFTALMFHKRGHYEDKRYACDKDGCDYKCISPTSLNLHKMGHTGIYPFVCNFPGCWYKCGQRKDLTRHTVTHSLEAQTKRLKQDSRVYNKLLEWGYLVDRETVVNASRGGCVSGTLRHFSRLDFHIVSCTNVVLIVECDEMQHQWYNLSCEMSRMVDVRAALVLAGYTVPIYWIRYSPNGKYFVGDDQIKIRRPQREEALRRHIDTICSPDFTPTRDTCIHYMFYDLISQDEGPKICIDDDFPRVMNGFVSW